MSLFAHTIPGVGGVTVLGAAGDVCSVARDAIGNTTRSGRWDLLQLREFGFGLPVDRDIGVGLLPKGEEVLIGSTRFDVVTR